MRIVDLSFPIRPHFRWKVAREMRSSHERGDIFESSIVTVACHASTHVDAPRHFLPGARHIAEMPIDQWIGEAAVVDLTRLGPDGEVTASDLERCGAHVRAGDVALPRTDWPRRVSVEDERFWREAPWTGRGACEWLVRRRVKVVGDLTNLDQIGAPRCRFLALPLKLDGADGSPVRAIAMVDQ
jgi:kynurenine formamidase